MNKLILKIVGSFALGATVLGVAATPAEARRYYRDRDGTDTAILAGVAGLAIGAALASDGRRYDRRYYNDRYYYDGPRYRGYREYRSYRGYPRYRDHYRYDRPRFRGYRGGW